jgi:hypothetical protein
LEIELLVVGNIITEDINLGGIKNSEEKMIEAAKASKEANIMGLRFFQRNRTRLVESNRLPTGCCSMIRFKLF